MLAVGDVVEVVLKEGVIEHCYDIGDKVIILKLRNFPIGGTIYEVRRRDDSFSQSVLPCDLEDLTKFFLKNINFF